MCLRNVAYVAMKIMTGGIECGITVAAAGQLEKKDPGFMIDS